MEKNEIAKRIREAEEYDMDDCRELCELAGLSEEWEAADGDTFESVLREAAKILGVDIGI